MFGLFESKMTVEKAQKQLRKLDKERAKLLKIINGHVISEDDIEHGISVINQQGTVYKIKSEGFGLYNLYGTNGFIERKVMPKSIVKYDLATQLNEHNFRIVG